MTITQCGRASGARSSRGARQAAAAPRALAFFSRPRATPAHETAPSDCACSSCEDKIDKWYTEDFHKDNFDHTTTGSYGPANFQSETVALVFWCHNKIEQCQIKISSISIGESANATRPMLVEEKLKQLEA